MTEPELKELMLRALDGDAAAYRRLLTDLRARLAVYYRRRLAAFPAEADDLVQEALLAIHAKRATFDRAQPLTAWVYAIARYKLVDHFRRSGRARFIPIEDDDAFAAPDASMAVEARRDIEAGLAGLPDKARDLVVRIKLEEQPVAEVAARSGMSEGAVKVAVHRAVQKLSARLRGEGGF